MGDVTLTTEDSVIPTNITTYHTVNITDNTTLYMLNFADINAAGHSFFESTCTNLMPENSDNPHQTMMVSVPDPIYHQTSVFSEGIVVSSSSVETLSSSTLPSSSSSLSSTVSASSSVAATAAGATISLHPNILLPIQLTTNSFSPKSSTVSTIGHNSSTGEEVIVSSNPWSTVMSCHPEPSLCYLITATEPIETEVSCDTGNSDCNHTNVHTITNNNSDIHIDDELGDNPGDPAGVNVEDNIRCGGDASNSLNVVKEQSISSVDILNSFQSEVNHMITDGVLKADCNSPQIQLNENCIFYESCSSSLSTAISSACSSLSMSSTFCPSTSIWRPIDDPVGFDSIAKHHQHHPFQIPMLHIVLLLMRHICLSLVIIII
ncbi:unnamed protein product [Heterobilharzia americana]|nr:unnamed protein product [Heterobilharzia americana]